MFICLEFFFGGEGFITWLVGTSGAWRCEFDALDGAAALLGSFAFFGEGAGWAGCGYG